MEFLFDTHIYNISNLQKKLKKNFNALRFDLKEAKILVKKNRTRNIILSFNSLDVKIKQEKKKYS